MWTLKDMLNTHFTKEVEEAWTQLFEFITKAMLEGVIENGG